MINKINLENFKSFRSLKNLKVKPITILTGTNSCGKSSILQSILLIKQTLESKTISENLLLNGRFVHLGNFDNVIYNKDSNNELKIGLSYNVSKEDFSNKNGNIPLYSIFHHLLTDDSFDIPKAKFQINYYAYIKSIDKKTKHYIKPTLITRFELEINVLHPDGKVYSESFVNATNLDKDIYECSWKLPNKRRTDNNEEIIKGKDKFRLKFLNLIPTSFELDNPNSYSRENDLHFQFYLVNELLKQLCSSFTYVGPLREEPSRRYVYEDEIVEIGNKGENAAFIFLSELENKIENFYTFDENSQKFILKKNINLEDAVNTWNKVFKIINFKAVPNQEVIRLQLDSSSLNSTQVNIADVGFGISQIFPIILEGLRMNSGGTLLLEQPEIHLHPKVQMQLADYFISLALANKNLIIETHSEHIINRLVRRIVEDDESKLKDLVAIYFIENSEVGSTAKEVKIDEFSGIINWPEDFFDQNANEQQKIMYASLLKRRNKNG